MNIEKSNQRKVLCKESCKGCKYQLFLEVTLECVCCISRDPDICQKKEMIEWNR
jgi:hypothetical protein